MTRRVSVGSTIYRRAALAALVAVAMGAGSSSALAQTDAAKKQAQSLQVEGLRLLQKGDNRGALGKFDEAFRLVPSPKILFNRAKAHRALGENADALSDFERFLDEAPYAPKESRAEATRIVEELRPTLSYLEVQTDDTGSTITIDGNALGTAPLVRPAVVAPGTHEVRVAKAGMLEDVRSVSPIAGQKLRVVVKLVPASAGAPPAFVSPPSATSSGPPPLAAAPPPDVRGPEPAVSVSTSASEARPWQTTAAWVAGGAGVLFLGAGLAAQVLSSSKASDFNAVNDAPNPKHICNRSFPQDGGGSCQGLADSADHRKNLSIASYVTAGVLLAGSLVLFLTAPSAPAAAHDVAAVCVPMAALGVSCALTLRF